MRQFVLSWRKTDSSKKRNRLSHQEIDGSYADWARKNGYTIRNCVCDCDGSIELDTRTLQRAISR